MSYKADRKLRPLNIPDDHKRPVFKLSRYKIGSQRLVSRVIGNTEHSVRQTEKSTMNPNLLDAFKYSVLFEKPIEQLFPDLLQQAEEDVKESKQSLNI